MVKPILTTFPIGLMGFKEWVDIALKKQKKKRSGMYRRFHGKTWKFTFELGSVFEVQ